MALRRSLLMLGLSLKARDTVATDTPRARAMSFMVIGKRFSIVFEVLVFQFMRSKGKQKTGNAQTIARQLATF